MIGDFNEPSIRGDIGALLENFIVLERAKYRAYGPLNYAADYFWRTQNNELDLVENYDGTLHAYEIKWNPVARATMPRVFSEAYPSHTFEVVNRDNIAKFLI